MIDILVVLASGLTFGLFIWFIVWLIGKTIVVLCYTRAMYRLKRLPTQYHNQMNKEGYYLIHRASLKLFGERWAINKKVNDRYSEITNDLEAWEMYTRLEACFDYEPHKPVHVHTHNLEKLFVICTDKNSKDYKEW